MQNFINTEHTEILIIETHYYTFTDFSWTHHIIGIISVLMLREIKVLYYKQVRLHSKGVFKHKVLYGFNKVLYMQPMLLH